MVVSSGKFGTGRVRLTSAVLAAALTAGTLAAGVATATSAAAAPGLSVSPTVTERVATNSSTLLTGLSVSGDADDTLQATVATDLGTLDIQDDSGNLVLAYANNWDGDASVTFSGSQDDINTALADTTLVTDSTTGTAHVSLTVSVEQDNYNYLAPNQHFYEYVPATDISWTDADAAAKARVFEGQHGYLATIPNNDVNDFVTNKINGAQSVWFGARAFQESNGDDEALRTVNGITYSRLWVWAPGADESPLAGQVISKCTNYDGTCDFDGDYSVYNSWAPPEPNNAGNEWAAVTNWGSAGLWNDLEPNSGGISGYVVEYGGKPNDDPTYGTGFDGVVTATGNVTVADQDTSPAAPVVTAVASDSTISLSWTPPADGGAPISSYEILVDGTWEPATTSTSTATVNGNIVNTVTTSLTGLANGNSYMYEIRAVNAVGEGDPSDPVSATPYTTPGMVQDVVGVAGDFTATVSWDAGTDNGGSAITGYTVTSDNGDVCTTTGTSCVVEGLMDGQDYTFTVHATNAAGDGAESAPSAAVTPEAPAITPSTPADTNQPQYGTLPIPAGGSVRLLDSHGAAASTVTVAGQGTYTLDTSTGVVTFAPVLGWTGTPTPVSYREVTSTNTSGTSTFSPFAVRAPAGPTASVLTSAAPVVTNQPQHTTASVPSGDAVTLLDGLGAAMTSVTVSGEGTYALNAGTGVITFTPDLGWTGTPIAVAYRVTDAYGQHAASTYTPSAVTAPAAPTAPVLHSAAPVVSNQPQHTTAGIPTAGSVTLLDSLGAHVTSVTVSGQGTYTLNTSTGVITFAPVLGFAGTPAPVGYRVIDAYGQGTSSTYAPSVVTAPAAPVAPVLTPTAPAVTNQPQSTTAVPPTGGSVTLIDGNSDPATTVTVPGEGTYTLDPVTDVVTFTPVLGYTGTPDPVTYQVTDAYGQSTDSTFAPSPVTAPAGPVALPVTPTDPADSDQPQQTTVTIPTGGTVTLVDGSGDPATTVTVPGEGTYVLDPVTGVVTFTPAPGFAGTPTPAGYQITDAYGQSSTSTFTPADVTLVPGIPTGVTVVPGNTTATVHFAAPATDGGLGITGYAVITAPGGARTPVDAAGDVTISGLTNGTAYTFVVVAINANGESLGSTPVTATPRTVPGAPTISGAVAGNGSVTLTVAAPGDNGGAPITGYSVVTSPGGARTAVNADGTVTITGLTIGVSYSFTAVATNVAGDSAPSSAATAMPTATANAPSLRLLKVGPQWLKVTVVPATATGVAVTGYTVTLTPGGRTRELTGPLGGVVRFTGLKNGVRYTAKAVAHSVVGLGSWSPALSGTPMAAPGSPKVRTSASITSLTIKLSAPKSNGGARIRSYRVTVSGPGLRTRTVTLPAKKKSLTVYGLRPYTRYKVVVTAANAAGRSKPRRVAAVTRKAPLGGVPVTQVAGHPIALGTTVSLGGDATFGFDSASLLPSMRAVLLRLAAGAHGKHTVVCAGYADFGGDPTHEYTLAMARATAVCDFLKAHGAAVRTQAVSYGGTRPLVTAGDSAARAQNRRVTVTFVS